MTDFKFKKSLVVNFNGHHWQRGMSIEVAAFLREKSETVFFLDLCDFEHKMLRNAPLGFHLNALSSSTRTAKKVLKCLEIKHLDLQDFKRRFLVNSDSVGISEDLLLQMNNILDLEIIDRMRSVLQLEMYPNSERQKLLAVMSSIYKSMSLLLDEEQIDSIFTFNSRFLAEGSSKLAAMTLGIPHFEFEQISLRYDSFHIFESGVHNTIERANQCEQFHVQAQTNSLEIEREAIKWVESRRKRISQKFTNLQVEGTLPTRVLTRDDRKVISCFLSSFDELVLAGLVQPGDESSQENALMELAELVKGHPNWLLVVREHPNMLNRSKSEQEHWRNLLEQLGPEVVKVFSNGDIDSYALIERSDLIVTFGSTVGVEASILNRCSILIGRALHELTGACIRVNHVQELRRFLEDNPKKFTLDNYFVNACRYAVFLGKGGTRFRVFKAESIFQQDPPLSFKKRKLKPHPILFRLQRLIDFLAVKPG